MSGSSWDVEFEVPRLQQPDDLTCGPTCLLQVLRHYGYPLAFGEVLDLVERNPDGGTLAVYLGRAALRLGLRATLYPFTLRIFDPSWADLPKAELIEKLARATAASRGFLLAGGEIVFADLTRELIAGVLARGHPLICGLSATWLYRTPRERGKDGAYDDIRGEPVGHFVVVCGVRDRGRTLLVSDPSPHAPMSESGRYAVPTTRLLNAILLGDATYDAVLVEIHAPEGAPA